MAERGVLSIQEAPKSRPEIERGGNRRKEDVDFRPHMPLAFQFVQNFESSKSDWKCLKGQPHQHLPPARCRPAAVSHTVADELIAGAERRTAQLASRPVETASGSTRAPVAPALHIPLTNVDLPMPLIPAIFISIVVSIRNSLRLMFPFS